ncbi:MAG: MBL fold metallo-hydrolase [Oscillospiraceae bacterium]|nr:MBL fold metallo-hydrolase [Oscillospiraceae bacterium]
MEVVLLGTGSILTTSLSSCAVLDSRIMLDCGNGAVKALRRNNIDPKSVDICLITHFHADHFFDIPFMLLEQGLRQLRENEFIIIGPNDTKHRIINLFNLAYPEDWDKIQSQSKLKVIEISEPRQVFQVYGYDITSVKVEHANYDAYGYIVSDGQFCAGFTGDAVLCEGVIDITESSNIVFADMSFENPSKGHMGLSDIEILMNEYGQNKRIIPTHMTDNVRNVFSQKHFPAPEDGAKYSL